MRRGIASVIIGMAGLLMITYFYTLSEGSDAALGEIQQTVLPFTMSLPVRMFLFTVEGIGIALGYHAYKGSKAKLGLLGMGLCTLCLIMLYGYTA